MNVKILKYKNVFFNHKNYKNVINTEGLNDSLPDFSGNHRFLESWQES